jgi:hypothetical protein
MRRLAGVHGGLQARAIGLGERDGVGREGGGQRTVPKLVAQDNRPPV